VGPECNPGTCCGADCFNVQEGLIISTDGTSDSNQMTCVAMTAIQEYFSNYTAGDVDGLDNVWSLGSSISCVNVAGAGSQEVSTVNDTVHMALWPIFSVLIVALTWCYCSRRRRKRSEDDDYDVNKSIFTESDEGSFVNWKRTYVGSAELEFGVDGESEQLTSVDVKRCNSIACNSCKDDQNEPLFIRTSSGNSRDMM
jgi:hypothetical protein